MFYRRMGKDDLNVNRDGNRNPGLNCENNGPSSHLEGGSAGLILRLGSVLSFI